MGRLTQATILIACFAGAAAQEREPRYVDPGKPGQPPSDAIALFDGKDLAAWTRKDGSPAGCEVSGGAMICKTGAGDIFSREKFRDAQIHVEFATPAMPDQKGQLRGNSGIYLQGRYEVQVLDSYNNPTYAMGVVGALYGIAAPMVNASRPPEQWQTFDIVFRAPRCSGEQMTHPGTVTALLNGVLVQDHVSLRHRGKGCPEAGEPGPLMLQDHSGFPNAPFTVMKFRNIWLRKLE
ncbi:MAG: DUF1080 domain-containing protein [Bryobacteraceae bacterium]|nr:DUF1080 domain-containing protein [Bryobacteraceae bacterium]